MRIAIAQMATVAGTLDATVARMVAQSAAAASQGVDLMVFPLSTLTGLDLPATVDQELFGVDVARALVRLAEDLQCPAIVPFVTGRGNVPMPVAVLVRDHKIQPLGILTAIMAKKAGTGDDSEGPIELEFGGHRLALALSNEDLDDICNFDYAVDTIIYLSGYGFAADDASSAMGASLGQGRFLMDAQSTNAWIVGVAGLGGYGGQVLTGSSFVVSPRGELTACAPAFEEALLVADIGDASTADGPVARLEPEVYDLSFHLWQALALSLHDAVVSMGASDVALLVGDDVASRVLLTLAVDAVGPTHVHAAPRACVNDPRGLAELARRLRVTFEAVVLPLRSTALTDAQRADDIDVLRNRALARAAQGAVMLSSLDKTALALGCWSFSQTIAELYPLADVYRSDILDMAHMRNAVSPLFSNLGFGEADVLTIDEADGPKMYATEDDILLVDQILLSRIEYGRIRADLIGRTPAEYALVDAIMRMMERSDPFRKRVQPVLIMSSRTLFDEQRPLGFAWADREDEVGDWNADFDELNAHVEVPEEDERIEDADEDHNTADSGMGLREALDIIRDLVEQSGMSPEDGEMSLFEGMPKGPFSEN